MTDQFSSYVIRKGFSHAVYWCYDSTGKLLYVGCSMDPEERKRHHALVKPWWPDVVKVDLEWYPDRLSALNAEAIAIATLEPLYNTMHQKAVIAKRQAIKAIKAAERAEHAAKVAVSRAERAEHAAKVAAARAEHAAKVAAAYPVRVAKVAARRAEQLAKRTRCPKCGGLKEADVPYCPPCRRAYRRAYHEKLHPNSKRQTGLCSRCRLVPHPRDRAYCPACKSVKNAEYRHRKALEQAATAGRVPVTG